jgi:hypothetical protein
LLHEAGDAFLQPNVLRLSASRDTSLAHVHIASVDDLWKGNDQHPVIPLTASLIDAFTGERVLADYRNEVRFRVGGSAIEGVDYALDAELADRTLVVPAGASEVELPIRLLQPSGGHGGRVLDVQLLSSDSGYGVSGEQSVVHVVLPGGAAAGAVVGPESALRSGAASSFREQLVVREANGAGVLRVPAGAGGNVVLEGVDGRKDLFLLGRAEAGAGLPQVRNFDPGDGDVVLIDPGAYEGVDIEGFNTYAGLVMHLQSGEALALISDVGVDGADLAWSGLSSSPLAGYYRYASGAELELPVVVEPVQPEPKPEPRPKQPPERGGVVPEAIAVIGRSSVVVRGAEKELEVRSGEMGLGSGRKDVLMAVVVAGEENKPVLLSAGGGRDVYGVADGGMTVIADGGGGKGDVVTGLAGDVSEWSWREIGGDGDVLLVGGEKGERTRVLLIDPLGVGDRANRIERMEIGGERLAVERALGEMEQRKRLGYGELNQRRGGVLGDVLGLSGKEGRGELVEVLRSNLQIVQETPFG